jgi:15-cis-phytoene synthase
MLQLPKPINTRTLADLKEAYESCRKITADYAKTFYFGTLLMTPPKRQAIWAIYAWCRRSDELVDGIKAQQTTSETLERWEQQLESIFGGHPIDDTDVALVDTLERFPMDIQPFRDMIAGQHMDLYRSRYETFEELKLYCYRVAGTVGLMSTAILGLDNYNLSVPWKGARQDNPTEKAIALGIAMQLSNILRDVGEDAQRGRIYLPLQDLELFGYTEKDLLNGVVDDRWRALMRFQIQRARKYYQEAEKGVRYLSQDARLPVWSALINYQGILDAIERNNYDVFNRRAFVSKPKKFASLPLAWLRAQAL